MSNILSLNVSKNNAHPDGQDINTVKATVVDDSKLPVSDITVLFHSAGNARFTNGNTTILRTSTDAQGECTADLVDTIAESVTITGQIPGAESQSVQITFADTYDTLEIESVSNENGIFPGNTFDIAWEGSSFTITTRGGSGSLSWHVTGGSGLAVTQEGSNSAVFTFRSADLSTTYTVTGKDDITEEEVSFSFILVDFVFTWLSNINATVLMAAGYSSRLKSKATLLKIYQQWGDISTYNSALNWFWTSEFSYDSGTNVLSAELVSLVNGTSKVISDTGYSACFADFKTE